MTQQTRFVIEERPYTAGKGNDRKHRAERRASVFVDLLLNDELVFSPVMPGGSAPSSADRSKGAKGAGLSNPSYQFTVDISDDTERNMRQALAEGALPPSVIPEVLREANLKKRTGVPANEATISHSEDVLHQESALSQLGLCAIRAARSVHDEMLKAPSPFMSFQPRLTDRAKLALALGWEAIARAGKYPLPPYGMKRLQKIDSAPAGAFHFVSASDSDAGYHYTMGIALSPEAQALGTTNVSFGLDGELIVPGQAVSPIPPLLSLATRLFASGIMSSSNISEEQHSIPVRSFPQPDNYTDLLPIRPALNPYQNAAGDLKIAIPAIVNQLKRNNGRFEVDAVIDISGLAIQKSRKFATDVLNSPEIAAALKTSAGKNRPKERIALFYNVGRAAGRGNRKKAMEQAVDLAKDLGLKYVAVVDDVEDQWLPGIHEYFEYYDLNDIMRFADKKGVIIIDGRPVDPMYTASTALQRIQSVMTTLSVDILKAGMWLTLDATTAEAVWRQIQATPAISRNMCLMPIGILEPWSAFVDNRNPNRNARAIVTPFSKVRFMIEEAKRLGMPSLLTDTRHKQHWVLLGARDNDFPPHPREVGDVTSLLSWKEFMECERLARRANILLGQAGSIEVSQIFPIISETTFDAAQDALNPATAFWTAETERVLRSPHAVEIHADLQSQRSAPVDPYLAVVNRIYESHAKMDGWLRFLATRYKNNSPEANGFLRLQEKLQTLKQKAEAAQEAVLEILAQNKGSQQATEAWNDCREAYTTYHHAVKKEFAAVRKQVASQWQTMRGGKAKSKAGRAATQR